MPTLTILSIRLALGCIGIEQQALAREGQAILIQHGIDPIKGVENLVWATKSAGQHTATNLRAVVNDLNAVNKAGGGYEDVVDVLKRHGKLAARR